MSEIICKTTKILHKDFNLLNENTSDLKTFKIKLSSYHELVPELIKYLNDDELNRAEKYHFKKDKNQFVICRALLKFILAKYAGLKISEVHIKIDKHRKPFLHNHKSMHFNLSHTKDLAVITLSNSAVGIDAEFIDEDLNFMEILPNIFNDYETETLLKSKNTVSTFYKFWTRKEAIVKATGIGISDSLAEIPSTDGHHIITQKLLDNIGDLYVFSFNLDNDYVVSIALNIETIMTSKLHVYNLPCSIKELISFSGC